MKWLFSQIHLRERWISRLFQPVCWYHRWSHQKIRCFKNHGR